MEAGNPAGTLRDGVNKKRRQKWIEVEGFRTHFHGGTKSLLMEWMQRMRERERTRAQFLGFWPEQLGGRLCCLPSWGRLVMDLIYRRADRALRG